MFFVREIGNTINNNLKLISIYMKHILSKIKYTRVIENLHVSK